MLDKLKDKYVFFDLDGTLSECRFNNQVCLGLTAEEFLFGTAYRDNRPLKTMVELVKKLDSERVYVLGGITTSHEMNEKWEWLQKYYPFIKTEHVIFIATSELPKEIVLQEYSKKLAVKKEEIVFIDDKHTILKEVENARFCCIPCNFIYGISIDKD